MLRGWYFQKWAGLLSVMSSGFSAFHAQSGIKHLIVNCLSSCVPPVQQSTWQQYFTRQWHPHILRQIVTSSHHPFYLLFFFCSDTQSTFLHVLATLIPDDQVDLLVYFSVPWKERLCVLWVDQKSSQQTEEGQREPWKVGLNGEVPKMLLLLPKSKPIFPFFPCLLPNSNPHITSCCDSH